MSVSALPPVRTYSRFRYTQYLALGIGNSRLPAPRQSRVPPAVAKTRLALRPLALALCACGGSGSNSSGGTPAGTYTLAITAKSGSVTQTLNLTLIVQ